MNKDLLEYQCYVFDLDNTLYDEREYLFSAYKEISEAITNQYNLPSIVVYKYLVETFEKLGRENLFDKLLKQFSLDEKIIDFLLKILRNHKLDHKIKLFPIMENFLIKLIEKDKSIFVLTNGNVIQQKNKIDNIFWDKNLNIKFVFANEIESKPSPKGLIFIKNDNNFELEEMVFIGDSNVDKLCALNASVDYLQVNEFRNLKL